MDTIAESDAKKRFTTLLDAVQRGKEVTITRQGKPVARIVPVENTAKAQDDVELEELEALVQRQVAVRQQSIRHAVDQIRALGGELRLDGITIRDLIHDGRR